MPPDSEIPETLPDAWDDLDTDAFVATEQPAARSNRHLPEGGKRTARKIQIGLPRNGRTYGQFCEELAAKVGELFDYSWNRETLIHWRHNTFNDKRLAATKEPTLGCLWCVKAGIVGRIVASSAGGGLEKVSFVPFKPEEFVTAFDQHFLPMKRTQSGYLMEASISLQQAKIILASEVFRRALPEVDRIFMYSLPIFVGIKNTDQKAEEMLAPVMCPGGFGTYRDQTTGQEVRFYCHRARDGSKGIGLEAATKLLNQIYSEFNFLDERSKTNALAHLLTPYCQNIIGTRKKSPLWMFTADAPRAGKDYAAMISPIVHEGIAVQDPPLEDESEFKRRITSAILAGRRFQHMANCRGAIDSPSLEAAVTTEFWSDRLIGTSESPVLTNEIIFSLSFNGDPALSPDITARARRVHLKKSEEATNKRSFAMANLHAMLSSWEPLSKSGKKLKPETNRNLICRCNVLEALYALVKNWVDEGHKDGGTFSSFPEWAKVVGGIMEAAGYGDPTQLSAMDLRLDSRTDQRVRAFGWFAIHEHGSELRTAGEIQQLLKSYDADLEPREQLFNWLWSMDSGAFGKMLARAAKDGSWNFFSVDCDSESDSTRPKYAFRFKEDGFLEAYADFAHIFSIPTKKPAEVSLLTS